MADVNTKLVTQNGDTVVIKEDSLPAAKPLHKGVVKQGASVAKDPEYGYEGDNLHPVNGIIQSLRDSGALQNTKFRIFYDKNTPTGVDEDDIGGIPVDDVIYETGYSATLIFDDGKDDPYCVDYKFLGWSTNKNATIPEYEYNPEDQQTYTVTFTNDDIVLYAIWEEEQAQTYTVTYSLGEYGQGSVPAAQTVEAGETVYVSFSPAPTVNDGSGRVFVGWATVDGYNTYNSAQYKQSGINSFSIYDDITLYPVFCAQYTLTYSLGNDGTGNVPVGGTYYNGQAAYLSFSPAPTCVSDPSKNFLGWATSDEQSSATYPTGGMMNFINMTGNVTLYPVFGVAAPTYTLTYALGDYATGSVPAPTTGTVNPMMPNMVNYQLSYTPEPTCTKAGTWTFIGWSTQDNASTPNYKKDMQYQATVMASNLTLYPVFGTEIQITVDNQTRTDEVKVEDIRGTLVDTISSENSKSVTLLSWVEYKFSCTTNGTASFTGTYKGSAYLNESLTLNEYEDDEMNTRYAICRPFDQGTYWSFEYGDSGTITISR